MKSSYHAVFDIVSNTFEKAGVNCLMIGGHAVNYYGYARFTADVDFMITCDSLAQIVPIMKAAGFTNINRMENVVFFFDTSGKQRVDFLLTEPDTFEQLLDASQKIQYGPFTVRVPSLDHLLGMKFFACRQANARRGDKDLEDIVNLAIDNDVSLERLKAVSLQFGTPELNEIIINRIQEKLRD